MSTTTKWILTITALAIAGCMCISVICIALGGVVLWTSTTESQSSIEIPINPEEILPTPEPVDPDMPEEPTRIPEATPTEQPESSLPNSTAEDTLRTLQENVVPVNDPVDLAERLKGVTNIPESVPATPRKVGDREKFWITNSDNDEKRQASAKLVYLNDVIYFWIEEGVDYDDGEVRALADTFANDIYPVNREFFGEEWNPGIDNDPRLHVLYVTGIGSTVAGYFSSADEVHPLAFEFSNAREMFVLSADNVTLGEEYVYSVMAHEFQHMIHYYTDRNEESWVNEGFSVLSELLNDYDIGGFDYLFISDPDRSLVFWPGPGESGPNYGASFLFFNYFLNRFGEEATQSLVAHPENGMTSVDLVLDEINASDPDTGQPITADDFFADWAVANFVYEEEVAGGRYDYPNYPYAPDASPTEEFTVCPVEPQRREVDQYGTDYIRFACEGKYTLDFTGSAQARLLPQDPNSGDYAFWSNKGDESDMTLTREFDFTGVSAPISLQYATWFDIEEGYDYVYLLASEDGKTWTQIETPSGTDDNPNGSNYGWGYNGQTGAMWVNEDVDLSQYAGKKVQIRFEYITDAAVNGQGLLLDDVRVDVINYASDFETDDGGWVGQGFVRVSNRLPQTFRATLILRGGETFVLPLDLSDGRTGSIDFEIGKDYYEAILVVSGTARYTNQPAQYEYEVR